MLKIVAAGQSAAARLPKLARVRLAQDLRVQDRGTDEHREKPAASTAVSTAKGKCTNCPNTRIRMLPDRSGGLPENGWWERPADPRFDVGQALAFTPGV